MKSFLKSYSTILVTSRQKEAVIRIPVTKLTVQAWSKKYKWKCFMGTLTRHAKLQTYWICPRTYTDFGLLTPQVWKSTSMWKNIPVRLCSLFSFLYRLFFLYFLHSLFLFSLINSLYFFLVLSLLSSSTALRRSKGKVVPLHALEAFGGRGGIAPTHSRPRQ
jgi:hypothetical protein